MYFVYIIQCSDLSLYTGITTDLKRRLKEHNATVKGAKYTKGKRPVRLVYFKEWPDRSSASVEEARIKQLSRIAKFLLIRKSRKEFLAERRKKLKTKRAQYLEQKEEARKIITERLEELNRGYGFKYGTVSIKNQKTCWGSCSKKGNLNFNYKLLHVAPEERDYVIVHELCHLSELNHSKKFWELVERSAPEYKRIRKNLKKNVL
jgi:predicted metal-dependent hydrolase